MFAGGMRAGREVLANEASGGAYGAAFPVPNTRKVKTMGKILPRGTPLAPDNPLLQGAIAFSVNRKRPTKTPSEKSKEPDEKAEKPKPDSEKS